MVLTETNTHDLVWSNARRGLDIKTDELTDRQLKIDLDLDFGFKGLEFWH
jgi:hypothetical protein